MKRLRKISTSFLLIASVFLLSGCGFRSNPATYKLDLEIWGVFDDSDAYTEVISQYKEMNPYIREIRYRKFQPENYKEELLNALAAGKGPDIFMIRNSWVPSFQDKIAPAPETMTTRKFQETFVDVASYDLLGPEQQIYSVPLSVDSLALYYNKDLLNAAGIATPPTTWEELAEDVRLLNQLDQAGNFHQSAVALGTAKNINRSTDILTAMMFQLGSPLPESSNSRVSLNDKSAVQATEFYTQFANIQSPAYSWNTTRHYSIDSFYEGTLGMMVNYSWQYPTIKQKNAKLNIGVAPLPQFSGGQAGNIANYWSYAVTKNKEYVPVANQQSEETVDQEAWNAARTHEAWQFLRYFAYPHENNTITLENAVSHTTKDFPLTFDPAERYLEKTKKPAARRDLIEKQRNDVVLAPFAQGNLIAKNWRQSNPEQIETILAEMIESIARGERATYEALGLAANRINVLAQPR